MQHNVVKMNEYTANQHIIDEATAIKNKNNGSLSAYDVVRLLDFDTDNRQVELWATSQGGIRKSDWRRAMREIRVERILGAYPINSTHFLDLVTASAGIECLYNGRIKQGKRDVAFEALFNQLKILSAHNDLRYTDSLLKAELQEWMRRFKLRRLEEIENKIAFCGYQDALWLKLAEYTCTTENHSRELVAAILKKIVWQVKRKMLGLTVTNHLMPVFLSIQGTGKSQFFRKFFEPIAELTAQSSFSSFEDDRRAGMWANYVVILDEMQRASKTDINAIKNKITAEEFSYRPMGTNHEETRAMNATFVGSSNEDFTQLISDSSGVRRFAPLDYHRIDAAKDHWSAIDGLDFLLMWQSVNPNDPDPVEPHEAELHALQERNRKKSTVECWLETLINNDGPYRDGTTVERDAIFESFSEWQRTNNPGYPHSLEGFTTELRRIMRDDVKNHCPFAAHRTSRSRHCYKFRQITTDSDGFKFS